MRGLQVIFAIPIALVAALPDLYADDAGPTSDAVRAAIRRAIPLLEKGAQGSADQRTCFTCHNQAVPVMALAAARTREFAIDEDILQRQLQHTAAHLKRGQKGYSEGRGQGGKVITAGYALWSLDAAGWQPDDMTAAATHYLLEYQNEADHWSHPGKRPPSSGSDYTATYVALRGLAAFGTEPQRARIDARYDQVREWLLRENPRDTEGRVFRLLALAHVGGDEQQIQDAVKTLIASQRDDGGWAQTADMESDAYATGTVLVALLRAGAVSPDAPTIRRGVQYLIDTQLDDGSWHVVTRAEPFQTYFETGFPHGTDQFISISASSWSTLALLLSLPESPSK